MGRAVPVGGIQGVFGTVFTALKRLGTGHFRRVDDHPFVEITVRRSKCDGFICDHINDNVKPGDTFRGQMGLGQFYYEPLRDAKHVMALAGGVGITPFASMAKEVAHGTLDMDLTILFGSVSSDDIALKEELEQLKSDRLRIVHVLSGDEPDWPGERGFLSAELIRKYAEGDCTFFICGPQVMYRFLHGELDKMGIPARRIRFEVFGQAKDITQFAGYPEGMGRLYNGEDVPRAEAAYHCRQRGAQGRESGEIYPERR